MSQSLEELGFGLLVSLQRAMEIQVLVRDVGHGGHVEIAAGHAALGQSMGSDLQHGVGGAGLDHASQIALDLWRVRSGGVEAGLHLLIADMGTHRADHAGVQSSGAQNGVDDVDGGRLAVGARDSDERQLARGKTVPGGAQPAPGLPRVGDAHVCELICGQVDGAVVAGDLRKSALPDDSYRAPAHCLGDEAVSVNACTRDGDVDVARLHLARIGGDAAYLDIAADPPQYAGQSVKQMA